MIMPAGAGEDFHEIDARLEKVLQAGGGLGDLEALAKVIFLGGDAHGTVVGVAGTHRDAADRLHGCIGDGDSVSTQRECFDKIRGGAKAAGDNECDAPGFRPVEMTAGAGKRGDGGDGDMVAENQGSGSSAAAPGGERGAGR